jgi:hypothetical protein
MRTFLAAGFDQRLVRRWVSALCLLLAVASGVSGACSLTVDRGGAIANDIRSQNSALISEVWYSGDDEASGPSLIVFLVEGASHPDGINVMCEVVRPAVERGDPPEDFGYAVLAADQFSTLAQESTPCPWPT